MKDYSEKAKIDFLINCGIEIWLPIKDFENYSVSSYGQIKNNLTNKILYPNDTRGYKDIQLYKGGKPYQKYIHRLVAETFIPNPTNLPEVDHKSQIKSNNSVYNLRWVDHSENCRNKSNNRALDQYDLQGNFIQRFNSIVEACEYLGVSKSAGNSNIYNCLKGYSKSAYKYIWKYADEN